MNKQEALQKVRQYGFAAYDMLLYLDTHPKDKKAFNIFKELVMKTKNASMEYEKEFGPLTPFNSAGFDSFNWLDSPWPWEKEGN